MEKNLPKMLEIIQRELFLEYEYSEPQQYPRQFITSFNLLTQTESPTQFSPIATFRSSQPISSRFQPEDYCV